jgi:serine/threonine-protein kinase
MVKKITVVSLLVLPSLFSGPMSAYAQNRFGAIAFSETTGDRGYAWDYSTRFQAENNAIAQCRRVSGARDCRILLWFRNACGSLASGANGAVGTGWGNPPQRAEVAALNSCRSFGGINCRVERTICSR